MTTVTSPTTPQLSRERRARRLLDATSLTGALFVLGVVAAAIVWGSNTPDGDASPSAVIAYYTDHRTQGIAAALILVVAAIPALAFAARLRERARLAMGANQTLPNLALAGGIVTAIALVGLAVIHLALSDYARVLDPSAAQALNALDGDSFVLLPPGIGTLVLAGSLMAIRSGLLPAWLGWIGIPIAIAMFTPVGFLALMAAGAWIIVASFLLFATGERTVEGPGADRSEPDHAPNGSRNTAGLTPTLGS